MDVAAQLFCFGSTGGDVVNDGEFVVNGIEHANAFPSANPEAVCSILFYGPYPIIYQGGTVTYFVPVDLKPVAVVPV